MSVDIVENQPGVGAWDRHWSMSLSRGCIRSRMPRSFLRDPTVSTPNRITLPDSTIVDGEFLVDEEFPLLHTQLGHLRVEKSLLKSTKHPW